MAARLNPDQLEIAIGYQKRQWTHRRIAEELGVRRETVSRSLARHNRKSLALLLKRIAETKGEQVEQLRQIAAEGYHAWEKSRLDGETIKTFDQVDKTDGGDKALTKSRTKTETVVKGQSGDARLLAITIQAMRDMREVLGIGADGKVEAQTIKDVWKEAEAIAREYQPARPPAALEGQQPKGPAGPVP